MPVNHFLNELTQVWIFVCVQVHLFPVKYLWKIHNLLRKTPKLKDTNEPAWLLMLPKCVLLAAMMLQYNCKMTAVAARCSVGACEGGLGRTHWVSEFLPCVMSPVNSTSLRASTWNQLLVSSGSAHHAPPYRSSSFSEPCSWPQLFLELVCHPDLRTNFDHNPAIIPIFQTSAARWKVMFTCMLSLPRWAEKPWWDWEEASSWSSSTRWDSRPSGGQSWKNKMSVMA